MRADCWYSPFPFQVGVERKLELKLWGLGELTSKPGSPCWGDQAWGLTPGLVVGGR